MNKNIIIFIIAFFVGALIALAVRTARHDPYPSRAVDPIAPATEKSPPPASDHEHHSDTSPADATEPVNTICAICGMEVNPQIQTALYQGKTIGFGCKTCPAKFAADPDLYGPAALANQVVE